MAVKFVVLYNAPSDAAAFDDHYTSTHVPIVEKMPGLRRFEHGHVRPGADGEAPPYYYMAELEFDDAEAFGAAMGSPEGQAAGADVETFASGGATTFLAEI